MAVASDATNGPLITMVTTTGVVYAKQGGLSAPWMKEFTGVARVAAAAATDRGCRRQTPKRMMQPTPTTRL